MSKIRIGPAEKLQTVHLILDGKETQHLAAGRLGISVASIQQLCTSQCTSTIETAVY